MSIRESIWKCIERHALTIAVAVTVAWTLWAVYVPWRAEGLRDDATKVENYGQWLSGALLPLTVAWAIGAFFLQRKELVESRRVFEDQARQQEDLAKAQAEANEIAAREFLNRTSDVYSKRIAVLKHNLEAVAKSRLGSSAPPSLEEQLYRLMEPGSEKDLMRLIVSDAFRDLYVCLTDVLRLQDRAKSAAVDQKSVRERSLLLHVMSIARDKIDQGSGVF